MGAHNNQHAHKRAAGKQRRLASEVDASKLKELVARFSPTFVWTTETSTTSPTSIATGDPIVTTTAVTPTTSPVTTPAETPTSTPNTTPATSPTDTLATTSSSTDDPATAVTTSTTDTNASVTDVTTTTASPIVVTTSNPVAAVTTSTPTLSVITPSTSLTQALLTSSASVASAAASATESASSGSGTNVGGVVGGIAGGLLGLAALVFVVRFIMSRRRRHEEDGAASFNAHDFRRSAILMDDPPTHDDTIERGFNPRPPTMIERRLASPAPTFGTQYGAPGPAIGQADYDYNQYQAYGPSQMRSPISATSAHPMFDNPAYPNPAYPAYGQSPFSPIDAPNSNPYEVAQPAVLTRQPSSATQLSRSPSANGPNGYPSEDPYGGYPHQAQNEYVDLDRSSVTPYQAAQYAEISEKLNTEVPPGLDTPAVDKFIQENNQGAPPLPSKDTRIPSPFNDPAPGLLPYPGDFNSRPSTDSVTPEIEDFPAPPSPAHSGRSRIDSTPPMLPEIHVESRPTSYDFPTSVRGSGFGSGYSSGVTKDFIKSPLGNQFPMTPSPLASSFGMPTPPPATMSFSDSNPHPTPRLSKTETPVKRPDTVYDDDDAYGGM